MSIKIITDSGCDLPIKFLTEYDVDFLPMTVHLDDKEYFDGVNLDPYELYESMRNEKVPTTSQVAQSSFLEMFTKNAKANKSCIYVCFSSALSSTYQVAMMVAEQVREEYPDFDLDIIDTKCASLGMGLVVHKAAQMAKDGKTKEEIISMVNFYINHMEHIFTVDNLEYLFRGGRVSKTAAFIGGLLNIKPVLNVQDGKLIPLEKVRGRKKVLKRMIRLMSERGKNLNNQLIGISHGDDEEGALQLKKVMEEEFGCEKFLINMIGGVIGSHSGPGTLAIFFLNEKPTI